MFNRRLVVARVLGAREKEVGMLGGVFRTLDFYLNLDILAEIGALKNLDVRHDYLGDTDRSLAVGKLFPSL